MPHDPSLLLKLFAVKILSVNMHHHIDGGFQRTVATLRSVLCVGVAPMNSILHRSFFLSQIVTKGANLLAIMSTCVFRAAAYSTNIIEISTFFLLFSNRTRRSSS